MKMLYLKQRKVKLCYITEFDTEKELEIEAEIGEGSEGVMV